jgi:hypothetical protein
LYGTTMRAIPERAATAHDSPRIRYPQLYVPGDKGDEPTEGNRKVDRALVSDDRCHPLTPPTVSEPYHGNNVLAASAIEPIAHMARGKTGDGRRATWRDSGDASHGGSSNRSKLAGVRIDATTKSRSSNGSPLGLDSMLDPRANSCEAVWWGGLNRLNFDGGKLAQRVTKGSKQEPGSGCLISKKPWMHSIEWTTSTMRSELVLIKLPLAEALQGRFTDRKSLQTHS